MSIENQNITFQNIQNGDKYAFEILFNAYYQHLCNFAFQFMKEQAASEEVVQEVFYKLWEKRQELNIRSSIKSYLFSSVRNSSLNQLKHLEVRDNFKSYNEQQIHYFENQDYDILVSNELNSKIENSISKLPEERQRVFKLSRYEGKKYKEIADELGISIKTVEGQMSKALKFMRDELSEYLPIIVFIYIMLLNNLK